MFPIGLAIQRRMAVFKAYRQGLIRRPVKDLPVWMHLLVIAQCSLSIQHFGPRVMEVTVAFDAGMRTHAWTLEAWGILALLLAFGAVLLAALVFGGASLRALMERINTFRSTTPSLKRPRPLLPRPSKTRKTRVRGSHR